MAKLALSLIFILLVFLGEVSSGEVGSNGGEVLHSLHPLGKMHSRKVLVEVTMDYDYGGPNPKHEPIIKKGRGNGGGGGGKNP